MQTNCLQAAWRHPNCLGVLQGPVAPPFHCLFNALTSWNQHSVFPQLFSESRDLGSGRIIPASASAVAPLWWPGPPLSSPPHVPAGPRWTSDSPLCPQC